MSAWKRDRLRVTVKHQDRQSHFAYTTAIRALCGLKLMNNRRWAFSPNQDHLPSCNSCRQIAARLVELRLESRAIYGESVYCAQVTRKGKRCEHLAVPGTEWCSSHSPAARLYASEIA